MRKLFTKSLLMAALMLCTGAWASAQTFKDFAIQVNNQTGTLLETDEQIQGTEFEFGVAVDADGVTTRVDKDAENAVAVVSGKMHSEHGSNNLKVVTKVDGPVKITFGNCTYNNNPYSVSADGGQAVEIPFNEQNCWKNGHASVTEYIYEGGAATLTINGSDYTPYIKVAAYEAPAEPVVFRNFAVQVNDQDGTLLTAEEQVQGTEFVFGVAVDADGVVTRVAADANNALAVVSGKYHSDHGSNNLKVVVAVDGKTKITFGNCTYSSAAYTVTPLGGTKAEIEPSEQNCWKNGHASVTEYIYNGGATTLTVTGSNYTPYIAFEAIESTEGSEYDNVAGLIAWANGNESNATADKTIEKAILETSVRVGTDLTVTGPTSYSSIPEFTVPLMTYQPTTNNPGCVPGDLIEYKVKLKKGLTLKVESVEFDAVKEATDNAYFSWSYTVDGVEGKIVNYSDPKTQIRRNNNINPDAPYTHVEEVNADAGREFSLRFYISNTANNKKMSIGNIKIHATVDGVEEVRAFQNLAIDFTSDPYTVTLPADGVLPEGVTVDGTWHDAQHGYNSTTVVVPVDGPVKVTFGNCQYNDKPATIKAGDEVLATVDCTKDCNSTTSWVYNSEEAATLTIITPSYCPSLAVEACELLPMVDVSYYDTNGKLLGVETVQGGSALAYKYAESDLTIGDGMAFRGWFASDQQTALKIAEGYSVQDNLKLYARATEIEVPSSTARFIYDLTKAYFYVEDHEAIEIDGKYYNNHGWLIGKNGTIRVNVAGKCYVTIGNCLYSAESTATVTDAEGNVVAEIPVNADADGAEYTFTYDGPAGWLTITYPDGSYTHSVAVWNVVDFVEYNEESGYYEIPAGDVSSFLIALKNASSKEGTKIFLPNGLYDLGTTVLTGVSGKNISIIGESMSGTIIQNAPPKEAEGIGVTATLLNTADGLYIQDLTIRNAMTFDGGTGRAVTLQDKGKNTICKNVSLESYQDTYYSNNNKAYFYFEDGEIHGVVDYVCGGGDVFYNRVKFVNEVIKNTTIAAPNGALKYGYVMMDCEIETLCSEFNLGRSWGAYSGLAWINTTINQPKKLAKTRFTTGGMNCAADRFVEYNTMDADGNVISPASNVLKFTHSTGDKEYETILTAEEAAEYAIDKVFPDWRPEEIAAQVEYTDGEDTAGNIYLVDGKIYVDAFPADAKTVRKANARGGFGPEVTIGSTSAISAVNDNIVNTAYYNLQGIRVGADYKGVVVKVETTGNGTSRASKVIR